MRGDVRWGKMPRENEDRDGVMNLQVKECQGLPATTLHRRLDSRLLASRTVKERISVILSHSVWGNSLQQP